MNLILSYRLLCIQLLIYDLSFANIGENCDLMYIYFMYIILCVLNEFKKL